jgi:hypothetical protein
LNGRRIRDIVRTRTEGGVVLWFLGFCGGEEETRELRRGGHEKGKNDVPRIRAGKANATRYDWAEASNQIITICMRYHIIMQESYWPIALCK